MSKPKRWSNQNLLLYHGTLDIHVSSILSAISLSAGRTHTDFGQGFYTTTVLRQAEAWAWTLSQRKPGTKPAVIRFTLKRDDLAVLETLYFVRGSFDADDFWSLIFHCRYGRTPHGRKRGSAAYDVVVGPVAASWQQRLAIFDADQISFHTLKAIGLLNKSKKRIL